MPAPIRDTDYSYPTYPEVYGGSIWVSHDHGATFTKGAYQFSDPVISIARDPFLDRVLYAGTAFTGVFRSEDAGATWEVASEGLFNRGAAAGLINAGPVSSLVADPARPGYVYAATAYGVFRSTDGARTWQSFSNGLSPLATDTLVISPDGAKLHAGTNGGGVFERDLAADLKLPCVPSSTRLCLIGARYAVDLYAFPGAGGGPGAARALGDRSGSFALPRVTGSSELPEVVVKMLPEGSLGGPREGAPVFYASLTTVPYSLIVTDTTRGTSKIYSSRSDAPLCGAADLAFGGSAAAGRRAAAGSSESEARRRFSAGVSPSLSRRVGPSPEPSRVRSPSPPAIPTRSSACPK